MFRAFSTSCWDGSVVDVHTGPTPGPPIWLLEAERMKLGDAATEATRARREDDTTVDFILAVMLWKMSRQAW